jgi:predicted nucleic acid-binding protein
VNAAYFIALVNPRDQYHSRAVTFDLNNRKLVTSGFVLLEVADGFSKPGDRQRAVDLIDALESDSNVEFISVNDDLYRNGLELFRRRPDQTWSLTDCTSFVLMQQLGLAEAITADHHFEQAGFTILLK